MIKNPLAMWETWVQSGLGKSPGEGNGLPTQYSCFLPGELSEQRSLTDYSPWGYKESGEKVPVSLSK